MLIAGGERSPVMKSTWLRLIDAGLVESFEQGRIRLTEAPMGWAWMMSLRAARLMVREALVTICQIVSNK